MISKYWKLIGLMVVADIALCIVAVATTLTEQAEKKISIGELPEAARATILEEVKDGTIEEIEMETEDGKTVYEAELIVGEQVESFLSYTVKARINKVNIQSVIDRKEVEIKATVDGIL